MSLVLRRAVFASFACWMAFLNFAVGAALPDRLINISSRTQVGTDGDVMIAGFIIAPGSPKTVLIRAIGPGLTSYGVTGVLADPVLELHDAGGATIATNDDWSANDATTMSAVGAFSLQGGSHDSVLVQTLNPGAYTAIVRGAKNTTGIGLVEVYEVDGTSRLINISTRAKVGRDGGVLISGLIVSSTGGPRKILIRAVGPTLKNFSVANTLDDPKLTLFDGGGTIIATNDNWEADDAAGVNAAIAQAGAFAFPTGSKDAALVANLAPGAYTVHVAGVNNTTGVALLEAYDISPGANTSAPTISVAASPATTSISSGAPATFVLTRSGDLNTAVSASYSMSGSAVAGIDYAAPSGSTTFAAGASTATVSISPMASSTSGSKTVTLTVGSVSGYQLASNRADVTIFYGAGSLYLANLRTGNGVKNSTAYGSATLRLSPDERYVDINLSFSNLTSAETSAYLRLSNAGEDGAYLVKIPFGQVSAAQWQIKASGGYTIDQIVAAIKAGKVYVVVSTENNPSGELTGSFIASAGSQTFVAPAAPPSLPATTQTAAEAARFLQQASFGPTKASIDAVIAKGYSGWIADQIALTASAHREATMTDFNGFNTNEDVKKPNGQNRQAAWWKIVVTGDDQLRQRVAFAFSELFVISDVNGTVGNWQEGAANYYDLLAKDGLGNFRTLLEDVTLSPMMGVYLSHIKNSKTTATTEPDENYAREVMQLFTVGLNQLQPDGTLKLDANGAAIPTYDQKTVSETARVFTGWQFHNANPTKNNFRSGGGVIDDYVQPMTLNPLFHDDAAKTIIGGVTLPAAQGGAKDLKDTLDALFNHSNTPPFIARHLIQRLVTSNPSPGYIYRVAQTFVNNGNGVRGDLAAVVKAVLLDYEARAPQVASSQTFGKLKEPLLRTTALLRAFNGAADNGRYNIFNAESPLAQAALRSPTVFNFFEPNYVVPGALAEAGLYAPEYQILTDTTAISIPNYLYNLINAKKGDTTISLDFTGLPAASAASALVDQLNVWLCGGSMPTATHDRIVTALNAMPASTTDTDRYRSAVYLTVTTQAAAVQK